MVAKGPSNIDAERRDPRLPPQSNRRSKLLGILSGGLLIYAINQVRIVALYYCLRFDHPLFEMLHGYIAPLVVIGIAGLYFSYWTSNAPPQQAA